MNILFIHKARLRVECQLNTPLRLCGPRLAEVPPSLAWIPFDVHNSLAYSEMCKKDRSIYIDSVIASPKYLLSVGSNYWFVGTHLLHNCGAVCRKDKRLLRQSLRTLK